MLDRDRVAVRCGYGLSLLLGVACAQPQLIRDAALDEGRLHDVVDLASEASRLRVLEPLSAEVVTRTELRELILEDRRARQPDPQRLEAERAIGMSSAGGDGGVELISRTVDGVYSQRRRTLYLVNERARDREGAIQLRSLGGLHDDVTLAHEVIHALQHQHHPELFEGDASGPPQFDAAIALQAAIEGTASLGAANTLGYLGGPRDPDELLADAPGLGPLDDEHPLLRELMLFPYTHGYRLAYYEGSDLLDSPPASTEQVLHPKRWGRPRSFVALSLSRLRSALAAEGCRALSEDTLGELGFSLWLRGLRGGADAQAAAEGWDGDRWLALACPEGSAIIWLTAWDSEQDAAEFERALAARASALRARATSAPWTTRRSGRELLVHSGGLPIGAESATRLVDRARVTTRDELLAHFREAKD